MSYLENLFKGLKEKATSGLTLVGNNISKGVNEFANGVANELKEGAQNAISGVVGAVGGALDNASQGIQNTSNWYSENVLNEVPSSISTQAPSTIPGQTSPSAVLSTAPTQTPSTAPTGEPSGTPGGTSGAPGTEAAPDKEYTSQYGKDGGTGEDHIPTYEEFLMGNTAGYDHIRTETSAFYDEQAKKTLEALDEQRTAADDYAAGQRDSVYGTLEEQKEEVYKYADEVLGESLGYNQQAYDAVVKLLGEELEAGKLNAEEAKDLLLSLAGETRQGVYDTAERQREEAHNNADAYRERANVNAQNAYAQNLAGYGANAEVLGRMGITGGGYGDWVNRNAYATQRAEVQAANAEAEGAKREATYTEDMLKLQADSEYNKQKGQAELDYLERLYNLDSNYRTDMAEAEQTKAAADKAAEDIARDTKFQADTLEREGKAEADLKYSDMLYQNEADYKAGKLAAEQMKETGQFKAEMDYVQNIMQNDERIAEYMRELQAGDEAAEEKRQALFTELLAGANSGAYDAEELTTLANMFGFDSTLTKQLTDSANDYAEERTTEKNKDAAEKNTQNFISLLGRVNSGELTKDEAAKIAEELGLDETQAGLVASAADRHTANTDEARAQQRSANIIALLDGANTGAYTAEEIPEVAKLLGLDYSKTEDKAVIDMIVGAANGFKTSEDTQYRNQVFNELMTAASSGALDSEAIAAIASRAGLGETEISQITAAATRKSDKNKAENAYEVNASLGNDIEAIENAVEAGTISKEDGDKAIGNIRKTNFETFSEAIKNGVCDTDAVDSAYKKGEIGESQYIKLKNEWRNSIDADSFFYSNNTLITKDAAEKALAEIKKHPWYKATVMSSLDTVFNDLYVDVPITKNVAFNNDGNFLGMGSNDLASSGNNFSIKDDDGFVYRVESGGEVTSDTEENKKVLRKAQQVEDGEVFGYNEKIYIKKNGNVYSIRARTNNTGAFSKHWDKLYDLFF